MPAMRARTSAKRCAVGGILLAVAVGCGSSSSSSSSGGGTSQSSSVKVGYISLGEQVPFVKLVSDGIKAEAAKENVDLVFCDSQIKTELALQCAQTFKTQQVQGILNFQVDQKSAPAICAAGPPVPVIAIDIIQPPCQKAFMGADNITAGHMAGAAMGKFIKDKFNCQYDAYVSLESTAAGAANADRMGGYRAGFQDYCPLHTDVKLDGSDRLDPARQNVSNYLASVPNAKVVVVVSINDDGILGALAAARAVGRTSQLYVSGQGADPSAWKDIKCNPNWVADTAYFPERYGTLLIPAIKNLIAGKSVPANIFTHHQLINASNIDQTYTVPAC
jgi:ribose transport system substrate-binding protein